MSVKAFAIAAWIAALAAWAIYERTLQRQTPPPPPPPPPPIEPCIHDTMSDYLAVLTSEGRDLLWMFGCPTHYDGPTVGPSVVAIAGRHELRFFVEGDYCLRCQSFTGSRIATFDYGDATIAHSPRLLDLTGDGRPELLVPVWADRWDAYRVAADRVEPLTPALPGAFPGLPEDLDGDGVFELIYWQAGHARFMVWDGERYREDPSLYEREMFDFAGLPEDYLFYAMLLGRFDDAFEVARPWILAAGEDEHALRERLERDFAPR